MLTVQYASPSQMCTLEFLILLMKNVTENVLLVDS